LIKKGNRECLNILMAANAGKAVMSQQTSVRLSGLVDNPAREFERLWEEEIAK